MVDIWFRKEGCSIGLERKYYSELRILSYHFSKKWDYTIKKLFTSYCTSWWTRCFFTFLAYWCLTGHHFLYNFSIFWLGVISIYQYVLAGLWFTYMIMKSGLCLSVCRADSVHCLFNVSTPVTLFLYIFHHSLGSPSISWQTFD